MASDVFQSIEVKEIHRKGRVINITATHNVTGATSGWTKNNDTGTAKLPESQTASTMTIPLQLENGTVIKSYQLNGQVESAGNTATLDVDLREITPVAGGVTDASLGAATQLSATADAIVAIQKTITNATVTSPKSYYFLVTGTTAAATDFDINSLELTVDKR